MMPVSVVLSPLQDTDSQTLETLSSTVILLLLIHDGYYL